MPDINRAYQWAIETCNRANVGYSQDYRDQRTVDGVTYYDCSSFIWYALMEGGFDVVASHGGNTWPFTTFDMEACLQALGFVEVPLSGEWKPGDIAVSPTRNEHTEMVYRGGTGRGVCMGAHTNSYALADQVSIGAPGDPNYETTASFWDSLWRYGDGASGDTGYGWTLEAFCALLGNIAVESEYNPGQIEGGYTVETGAGIGLFQWTPSGRDTSLGNPLINQAEARGKSWTDPDFQCEMINNADSADYGAPEEWGWITQYQPPASMAEFRRGTDIDRLTEAWTRNVERPNMATANLELRIATANEWYTRLSGVSPSEGASRTWVVKETSSYGALTQQEIYNNVLIMYNIFCGSGGGGGTTKKKKRGMPVWMMIRYHY